MIQRTPEERILRAKVETLLGERGKPDDRAVRLAELTALRKELDRIASLCDVLAKRITALE